MARISMELPGDLIELVERQAAKDGHENRCAVIRKALNAFFAGSGGAGRDVAQDPTVRTDTGIVAVELSDDLLELVDKQAKQDGHTVRSAVIRKALNYFFAR